MLIEVLNPYEQHSFLRIHSKNTIEYKTICLLNYIQTGDEYWHKEGTTNHDILDNSIFYKEIQNERRN